MNETASIPQMNSFSMLKAMVGIGAICGLLIVLTYESTKPRIEQLKEEALQQALLTVLPEVTELSPFTYENGVFVPASGEDQQVVYAGYGSDGSFKGIAIEASGQGYADIIRILYGYDPEKQAVVGFYVLESKETPGLGDKIEKDPNFLENFDSLDASLTSSGEAIVNPIVPVKSGTKTQSWEIDAITGATISSRAIASILAESTAEWAPIIYENQDDFKKQE